MTQDPLEGETESSFFWDWETGEIVRRINVDVQMQVTLLSTSTYIHTRHLLVTNNKLVAITSDDSFYILRFDRDAYEAILAEGSLENSDEGAEEAFEVIADVPERDGIEIDLALQLDDLDTSLKIVQAQSKVSLPTPPSELKPIPTKSMGINPESIMKWLASGHHDLLKLAEHPEKEGQNNLARVLGGVWNCAGLEDSTSRGRPKIGDMITNPDVNPDLESFGKGWVGVLDKGKDRGLQLPCRDTNKQIHRLWSISGHRTRRDITGPRLDQKF
ncbi:hypothetical protein FB446DRAFT_708546 [Lentinula raphanica]|nr:hypothetical protein FB446DRAFT_708546 [Lentinula raphanica]